MHSKMLDLSPLFPTGHMTMNVDLLALGKIVFYLRGATGEGVSASVVDLSSFWS